MNIKKSYLTKNPCYTAGKKITVKGIMIHSVGCPQPSAQVFVNNWNSTSYDRACVHAFIEADGDVYQTLPWNHRGWHCGGSGNNTHIGVEMCEPATIKYISGATWQETSDGTSTKKYVQGTYNTAVELFAYLCKEYDLDPLADGVIISHKEGATRGIASNHGDPEHIWSKFGYTMAQFRKDIKAKIEGSSSSSKTLYCVQIGAYSKKENAEAMVKKLEAAGFDTYITTVNGLYKVQVGAYSVKANAEAMLQKLIAAGFEGIIATK